MHIVATDHMSEASDQSPADLYKIAINGDIGRLSNPLIMESSKPDPNAVVLDDIDEREKGPKTVNVRHLYINGRRLPQGLVLAWRLSNTMADRNLVITLPAGLVEAGKPKNIHVDEFFNGRLQSSFEWRESDEKRSGPAMITTFTKPGQEDQKAVAYRLFPASEDTFSR